MAVDLKLLFQIKQLGFRIFQRVPNNEAYLAFVKARDDSLQKVNRL